jgi:hypothetical protein
MATNWSMNQENASRIPVAYLILGYENNRRAIIDFHRNARAMINWVKEPSGVGIQIGGNTTSRTVTVDLGTVSGPVAT